DFHVTGVQTCALPIYQPVRHVADRAHVVGRVLTGAPVAAGRGAHQAAALVDQAHRQPVDLQLAQVVDLGAAGLPLHPGRPGQQLLLGEDVVQAEHPLQVVHRGELGRVGAPDLLGGRLRDPQLRPLLLELLQPAHELVELGVADGGRVLDVVGELVAADLLGQLLPLVTDVVGNCLGHAFILAYRADAGGLRRPRGAVRPMSTEAPRTTAAPRRTTGPRLSPRTRTPRATDTTGIR